MILRLDPCGLVCVLLVYGCIAYADYVFIYWLILPSFDESLWGVLHVSIFNILLFLMCFAHTRAMTSDPGIVPLSGAQLDFADVNPRHSRRGEQSSESSDSDNNPPRRSRNAVSVGDNWTVCGRCEAYRPPRAHHCRVCKRCVRKMDHHCPWINNCVGEFNQKYFLQFLMYVGVASVYCLCLVAVCWAYPCKDNWCTTERHHHTKVYSLHSIFVTIECVLFCLFVIAVSCDQVNAIISDETAVEQIQRRGPHRPSKSKRALMRDVCGPGPLIMWIWPCDSMPGGRDIVRMPGGRQSQYNV